MFCDRLRLKSHTLNEYDDDDEVVDEACRTAAESSDHPSSV